MTTISIMFLVGIAILLGWARTIDKLAKANERNKKIYHDAARERWQAEKKESL